jgi:hypothetical protein
LSFGIFEIIKLFQKVIIYQNIKEIIINQTIAYIFQKKINSIEAIKVNHKNIFNRTFSFNILLIFLNIKLQKADISAPTVNNIQIYSILNQISLKYGC